MNSLSKQETTIEFKSRNPDGSIKEHFKVLGDGTVLNLGGEKCQQ